MLSLPELQARFTAAILTETVDDLEWIRPGGLPSDRRLAIHRNNVRLGLIAALADGFPSVERLVGAEFFATMAAGFIASQPPRSGCLLDFGEAFAAFIDGYPPAASLAYLSDVARLEWLWHCVFHGDEGVRFGPEDLLTLPPETYPSLRLRRRSGTRLFVSRFPVLEIMEWSQADDAGERTLEIDDSQICRVLLLRNGLDIELHALSSAETALLQALDRDTELDSAFDAAMQAEPHAKLEVCLDRLLRLGALSRAESIP